MTREEAKDLLDNLNGMIEDSRNSDYDTAFKMAIKALEQEPCEDCVRRQEVLDILKDKWGMFSDANDAIQESINTIKALKPVTPKQEPKTGHWIETAEEYYKAINEKGGGVNENTPYFTDDIACSECLAKFSVIDNETERFICCPNCGAKMESEDE